MSRQTIFENKTTMEDAVNTQHPIRTDMTAAEARVYEKTPMPGERKNPLMNTRSVDRPRRGHDY